MTLKAFHCCFFILAVASASGTALAQSLKNYLPTESEASTLPDRTFRIRLLHKSLFSNTGFTDDALVERPGIDVSVKATALIIDSALTDNVTLSIGLPYIYSNKATFDGAQFKSSDMYRTEYTKNRELFIDKLVEQGRCADKGSCYTQFENGMTLPVDLDLRLPSTNEMTVVPRGAKLNEALSSLILSAAKQKDGAVGIGDIETGLRYKFLSFEDTRFYQSAATFGARAPTGRFADVPQAERAVGRGVWEGYATLSGDAKIFPTWIVSTSYQLTSALSYGTKKQSGIVNNTQTVNGKCDAAGEGNNKDGLCQPAVATHAMKRNDFAHLAVAQTSLALAAFHPILKQVALTTGGAYSLDSILIVNEEKSARAETLAWNSGFTVTGLNFDPLLPFELSLKYEHPLRGRNQIVAPRTLTLTLSTFLQR